MQTLPTYTVVSKVFGINSKICGRCHDCHVDDEVAERNFKDNPSLQEDNLILCIAIH